MKRPFEDFAAWRLAATRATPAMARPEHDDNARQRWDGEGGNIGMSATRRKLIRANALARVRRAAFKINQEHAWNPTASNPAASAKG